MDEKPAAEHAMAVYKRPTATEDRSSSHLQDNEVPLSSSHEQYLLWRHGTLDLVPLPSDDPGDPLNWPAWKKNVNLALVAFHGLMSTGGAVAAVPAFDTWSKLWGISINTASYLGSAQMITLAIGPLIWLPLANHYGRRPVWLLSTLGAGLFNIACALSRSYGELITMRILQAFFTSPGIAMGQAVVAESFFARQRAQKMGVWTLMITLGPPMGPFVMGFVIQHLSWQWMFWIMAIINFSQMVAYAFLGPETLYDRGEPNLPSGRRRTFVQQYLHFGKIVQRPLSCRDFMLPFYLLADYRILLATIAYAITFNFTLVMPPVEIPFFFIPLFHLSPQQIGLNFLSLLIGCTLGEIVGGPLSDLWQNRRAEPALGHRPAPERRLWLSHIGSVLSIVGLAVFCVTLAEAEPLHWTVKPVIGVAIAGFGVQIVTTIAITYCSDCHSEIKSSAIGVAINFVRCTWGFIGPFWFPHMFDSCGLKGSSGLMAGIIILCTIAPLCLLQVLGQSRASRATSRV